MKHFLNKNCKNMEYNKYKSEIIIFLDQSISIKDMLIIQKNSFSTTV